MATEPAPRIPGRELPDPRGAASLALIWLALAAWPAPASAQGTLPTGFDDQSVVSGLDFPVGMAALPDGRVFVVEQFSANIRLIVNGAISATDPVCVIDQVNSSGGEQGLLGIAVDPGWPARPYIYVHCDATVPANRIRISRYTVTGDLSFTGAGALSIDIASRRDLITDLPDSAPNHNGGTLRFGIDGRLYDSMGEDAQACLAQDDSTLHGVILRLDVSRLPLTPGGPPTLDIITPPDNAQIGASNPRRRLIDAWGLRNPFRFQIDPLDGSRFIGDVGESSYEEVDRLASGGLDFGWPYFEGPTIHDPSCDTSSVLTRPIAWYDRRSEGSAAVIAACVYRPAGGAAQPFPAEYQGDFFFSDYYSGVLRRIKGSGSSWSTPAAVPGQPSPTDWGEGFDAVSDYLLRPDGSLWYCRQDTGELRRIVYTAGSGGVENPAPSVNFAPPFPQPSRGSVTLTFELSTSSTVHLAIYDIRGRRVRTLIGGESRAAGSHPTVWDGLDDHGRAAPSGYYVARLDIGSQARSHPVLLVR